MEGLFPVIDQLILKPLLYIPASIFYPIRIINKVYTINIFVFRDFFRPDTDKHANNDKSICQQDGTWSRDILKCTPDCGRLNSATPLVVNGWEASESFPWHVSIYVLQGNDYRFWCGATLITEAVVLTAAHCVWGNKMDSIRLVMGTTETYYNDSDSVYSFAKHFTLKNIYMHPLYLDKYGNYGSDIALLEINETVEFTESILPVCIDWDLDDITSHLAHQSLGWVMGMGANEHHDYSDRLRVTSLPVVSNSKCIEKQKPDFRKFVTFTTFCAGWENGTAVCNGDSGGGLVFRTKETNRWCLQVIFINYSGKCVLHFK